MCVRERERKTERELENYPLDPLTRIVTEFESRVIEELWLQHRVYLQEFRPYIAHCCFLLFHKQVQSEWETEKDFVCLCLLKTEGPCHVWSRRVVVFVTTEFTTVSNLVTRNFAPILVWDYLNFMMIHCYVQNQ